MKMGSIGNGYLAVVVNGQARGVFVANDAIHLHELIRCARAVFGACSAISMRLWCADEIDMVFFDADGDGTRKMLEHETAEVCADVARMARER